MILVSACLAGINCRYDGRSNRCEAVEKLLASGEALPVCPEQLGGFSTPRPAAEIIGGTGAHVLDGKARVMNKEGKDVTEGFVKGACETLKIARLAGAKKAVLKSKSPSCGLRAIYDGSFTGKLINGSGVTAELLRRNGIKIIEESEIQK